MFDQGDNPYSSPALDGRAPNSYAVKCGCGHRIAVQASQAGSTVNCACGAMVDVPRLSRLRASAGEEPIPLDSIDRIRLMLRNDELPADDWCCRCGRPTSDVIFFRVQCERPWVQGNEPGKGLLAWAMILLGGLGTVIVLSMRSRQREEFGRDISIDLPIRVCSACRPRVSRTRWQRSLKRILGETPIYRCLLIDFPRAIVTPMKPGQEIVF